MLLLSKQLTAQKLHIFLVRYYNNNITIGLEYPENITLTASYNNNINNNYYNKYISYGSNNYNYNKI